MTKQAYYNSLEESISIVEKTSKKLLPIYQEVLSKISIIEKNRRSGNNLKDINQIKNFDHVMSPNDSSDDAESKGVMGRK